MPKIFVSDAIGPERPMFGAPQPVLAPAWKALSALYQAGIAASGHAVQMVTRPEIYQSEVARQLAGVEAGDWHLAVKPPEHLRPFHGIPNVFVCNWPFAEFSTTQYGISPFSDQLRLLRQADAIIGCTDAVTQALQRAGVERMVTLPPPLPAQDRSPPPASAGRQTFLTTGGMGLPRTVEGFLQASGDREDLHLTVWTWEEASGLRAELARRLSQDLPNCTISFLTPAGIAPLPAADFFLCSEPPGVLDIVLAQAMQAGLPIIGAPGQGLHRAFTLPLDTQRITADPADASLAFYMPLTCELPLVSGIRNAILAAAALDSAARHQMGHAAQKEAERLFGPAAFAAGLAQLMAGWQP